MIVNHERLLASARELVALSDDPHPGLPAWHREREKIVERIRSALAGVPGQERKVSVKILVADVHHCADECVHLEKTKAWCRLFSRRLGWERGEREELLRDAECKLSDVTGRT